MLDEQVKIYLIEGTTGEYSDRSFWNFCAFTDKKLAEDKVMFLENKILELGLKYDECTIDYEKRYALEKEMRKYDPSFQCDYTGTRYQISETALIVSPTETTKEEHDDIYPIRSTDGNS